MSSLQDELIRIGLAKPSAPTYTDACVYHKAPVERKQLELCPINNKVCYDSRAAALAELHRQQHDGLWFGYGHPFHCALPHWHLSGRRSH